MVLGKRRSSGRFVRVDAQTIWLDAEHARSVVCLAGQTSDAPLVNLVVAFDLAAARTRVGVAGITDRSALVAVVPLDATTASAAITTRTSSARLTRDDTAEVINLLRLIETAKPKRSIPPADRELAEILALVELMKKKT